MTAVWCSLTVAQVVESRPALPTPAWVRVSQALCWPTPVGRNGFGVVLRMRVQDALTSSEIMPNELEIGQTYSFTIAYTASVERDMRLDLVA